MRTTTCLMSLISPCRRLGPAAPAVPAVPASAAVAGVAAAVAPMTAAALRMTSLRDRPGMAPEPPDWAGEGRARRYGWRSMAAQHEAERCHKPSRTIGSADTGSVPPALDAAPAKLRPHGSSSRRLVPLEFA